jgi:hypothetical protein
VNSGATVPSGPARQRLGFGPILWALLPLLSLGLLAPVPFAVAAVRLRQRRLWVATAGYAIGSALLIVGAFSPEGGWGEASPELCSWCSWPVAPRMRSCCDAACLPPSPTGTTMRPRWLLLVVPIAVLLLGVSAGCRSLGGHLQANTR